MLQRFLLLGLTALSLVAFLWPEWVSSRYDPFTASRPVLPELFAATMFAIGCLLPRDEVLQVRRRWPTVLGGTAIQYLAMPSLAYGFGRAFGLEQELFLGVVLVGCVPGAMASNVLTLTARGNVSYSVSLTTTATLVSPLIVPGALYLMLRQTGIDAAALARDSFTILIMQVVGPVVAGYLLSQRWQGLRKFMLTTGPVVANLTILWIIAVVVHDNRGSLMELKLDLALALLAVNGFGYLAGYAGGFALRLPGGMRRALTLEIGMQNAGLGTVMAGQLFAGQKLIELPPALYTFGCMLTGTVLAQLWRMRQPANAADSNKTSAECGARKTES